MNQAMLAAASGMVAQQRELEIVADNLANAEVAGFKASGLTFAEVRAAGVGFGTAVVGARTSFTAGKLEKSGGGFDCAIDGAGFFRVERAGAVAYTRAGAFARAADGSVRNADGWQVPGVRIPPQAIAVHVATDGRVTYDTSVATAQPAGRIGLVAFSTPEALRPLGNALYAATPAAGSARALLAGAPGGPKIAFGMLEQSNVSIVAAMMQILAAQRAYEANAKGVQAADEMQRIANNLHRS
jgi:flagellar basal-body rod protein FlgG